MTLCNTLYYNDRMEPMALIIRQLIWDDWNVEHISRHNMVPAEVELSLADEHAVFLRAKQGRVMVLGRAKKRLITTILNEQNILLRDAGYGYNGYFNYCFSV